MLSCCFSLTPPPPPQPRGTWSPLVSLPVPTNPNPSLMHRNDPFPALLLMALETSSDTYLKPHALVLIPSGLLPGLLFPDLTLRAWARGSVLHPLLSPSIQSPWGAHKCPRFTSPTWRMLLMPKSVLLGLPCLLSSRPTNSLPGIFLPSQYPIKYLRCYEGLKQNEFSPPPPKTPISPLVTTTSVAHARNPTSHLSLTLKVQSATNLVSTTFKKYRSRCPCLSAP